MPDLFAHGLALHPTLNLEWAAWLPLVCVMLAGWCLVVLVREVLREARR
jgi:hypothetical protein